MTEHHFEHEPDDEEAEGLALYARLREEARAQILASAAALAALPIDVSRRALLTILALVGIVVHDAAVVSTGQPATDTITAQAVAACIDAVCAITGSDPSAAADLTEVANAA